MIEISGASVIYNGDRMNAALKDINFSLSKSKAVIVGPNGSGKTTLIKLILGLIKPESGEVLVSGREVGKSSGNSGVSTNLVDVYKLIGSTIRDTVEIFADLKGSESDSAFDLIRSFELDHTLDRKLIHLSSGEQKMIGNILSLSFCPETVLMDEPFDNVDRARRIKLSRIISDSSAEILLNTHETDLIKHLEDWSLYLMIEGNLFGKFEASMAENLFLNAGKVDGAISVMNTRSGVFSMTKDRGQIPVLSVKNFDSVLWEA